MTEELDIPNDNNTHEMHPSLAALGGKIDEAKQGLDDATQDKNYTQKRVKTAKNLMSDDLSPFKNKGDRKFKIKYDGIGLYQDKDLEEETFAVMIEKDSVISGTYINDKVVLFGDPYNVYCSSINVEPIDIEHSQWNDKNKDKQSQQQHEYDTTVIINIDDIDQVNNELEEESAKKSVNLSFLHNIFCIFFICTKYID